MARSFFMAFIVPFDGSELAETALVRAVEFSQILEETVVAVTVIPKGNTEYAREHGWVKHRESFDMTSVVEELHEQVIDHVPEAEYRHIAVGRSAPSGTISSKLRRFATNKIPHPVFALPDRSPAILRASVPVVLRSGLMVAVRVASILRPGCSLVARLGSQQPHDRSS